jgi:hypothetical protein
MATNAMMAMQQKQQQAHLLSLLPFTFCFSLL